MEQFNEYLVASLKTTASASNTLFEAMRYSLNSGGKRFRPMLLLTAVELGRKEVSLGFPAAAALEWIHTYSLIHDDLPAMDDDDYRRGKLTTHKKFNEAIAILAGDGLLTASFSLIVNQAELADDKKIQIIRSLSDAAGPNGMVAGQMNDIEGEEVHLTIEQLAAIHQKKTGALIEFAISAGCLIADVSLEITNHLMAYGKHLGLAYQIHNDLKDVLLDVEESGKEANRDEALGKNTYPSLLGKEGAIQMLEQEIQAAVNEIETAKKADAESKLDHKQFDVFLQLLDYVKIDTGA